MKQTLLIKNMVCDRCKKVITDELGVMNILVTAVELGKIEIDNKPNIPMQQIENVLGKNGFELLKDEQTQLVEKIKVALINLVDQSPIERKEKLSVWLSKILNTDYSKLSRTFSRKEQITIEKFLLKLKVEKVKELIQQGVHTFSEIAYLLDYANSNHLAKQFKNETGMSMSAYKSLGQWSRKPLDKII